MSESETHQRIIAAAIRCFVHFGVRKSAMADIAEEAGVSRQTLYDAFGSKDALIRAAIRAITTQAIANIERRWASSKGLADQLDVFLDETVVRSFDLLQTARDPDDLISGHNAAGADAIAESHARHGTLMTTVLARHSDTLRAQGLTPEQFAHYVVSVAMGFKYVKDRSELMRLMAALRASVIATVGESPTPH
ncbi:MAG: helix-turn-helix domain-containing protein [Pseudomonadota bacterium]